MNEGAKTPDIRELFDDVLCVLQYVSEQLYLDVMEYIMSPDDALPLPRATSSELSLTPKLLSYAPASHGASPLRSALEIFRPGWSPNTHRDACRRLNDQFASLGPHHDRAILRFGRVMSSLSPVVQRNPLVPGSIASLIRFSSVSIRGIQMVPVPAMSVKQWRRLLAAEGFSERESQITLIALLLNDKISELGSMGNRVRDIPDAVSFLVDSRHAVLYFLDDYDPGYPNHVLDLAQRNPNFAELSAPYLVRAVIGAIWDRQRNEARVVLRATPVAAYHDELARVLVECTTGLLPRAITMVEKFEDVTAGAALLQQVRAQTTLRARHKLLDAAIERMSAYAFAALAFEPPPSVPRSPITDSPMSTEHVETLRAAFVNRRKRALTYAKARQKEIDVPRPGSEATKYRDRALHIAVRCDELLTDFDAIVYSLEGRGPSLNVDSVLDKTLLKHLSGFTLSQKLRLIGGGGSFDWWMIPHELPLVGVTAKDIVDFGVSIGHNPDDVGYRLMNMALSGWEPLFVVEPTAMWPVAEDYLSTLDVMLGLIVDSDGFRFVQQTLSAVELFAASPEPLPQYLASVKALTRSHSKFIKQAAIAALERYHLAP